MAVYLTGSQCNFLRSGVENLVCLVTILARVICTPCSFSIFAVDRLLNRELQWSRRLLTSAFAIKMAHSSDTNCLICLKSRNWTKQPLQIFRTWAVSDMSLSNSTPRFLTHLAGWSMLPKRASSVYSS